MSTMPISRPNQYYTTKTGYTYTIPGHIDLNIGMKEILEDAEQYQLFKWISITEYHYKYLVEFLRIERDEDAMECEQSQFIYKHREGAITTVYKHREGAITTVKSNTGYYHLGLFCSEDSIEEELWHEIFSKVYFTRIGLNTYLDPNRGGIMNAFTISQAALIMYG